MLQQTKNTNLALISDDCTKIFIASSEDMIHPFAQDYFRDMLQQLNINQQRRK